MSPPAASCTWVERAMFDLTYAGQTEETRIVRWVPTYNLLVRRSAFEAVGGFDESLATCEDCDLGYKLAHLGPQILDRRTTFSHDGDLRTLGELFRREAWRLQRQFSACPRLAARLEKLAELIVAGGDYWRPRRFSRWVVGNSVCRQSAMAMVRHVGSVSATGCSGHGIAKPDSRAQPRSHGNTLYCSPISPAAQSACFGRFAVSAAEIHPSMTTDAAATSHAAHGGSTDANTRLPMVLHTRVITGQGGGPDKTILNSPRFLPPLGYQSVCALSPPTRRRRLSGDSRPGRALASADRGN